jgi:uncharacterized membrane protein
MNIHPIFVHFPIAFLTIYAIAELIRFKKIMSLPYYFYIKAVLVILGSLTSFIAMQTGEMAEEILSERSQLVEKHSAFANISAYIFGFISIVYVIHWYKLSQEGKKMELVDIPSKKIQVFILVEKIYRSILIPILALIGLATITITGALGGAIVYGQNIDPFVNFIYSLVM